MTDEHPDLRERVVALEVRQKMTDERLERMEETTSMRLASIDGKIDLIAQQLSQHRGTNMAYGHVVRAVGAVILVLIGWAVSRYLPSAIRPG